MQSGTHKRPILLISCYELGHQPQGLVVPAGVLGRAGYDVNLNDIAVESLDEDSIITASLIGVSVPMHTALRLGVRVARRVRELNPAATICFYGLYARLNEDYLVPDFADACLGAEYESELLELARCMEPGDAAFTPRAHEEAMRSNRSLDLTPARSGLAGKSHYVRLDDAGILRDVGYVATTRGCKHTCGHCPITPVYTGRFYALPEASVLRDVEVLVEAGVSHITFSDPDFLNGPGHARRIARGINARYPHVTFDYTAKVEHLLKHRGLVEELNELGNLFVVTAMESLNDDVLRHLEKGHTRADSLDVIRHSRSIGLTLRPTLVPFTPWETLESYIDLLDAVAGEGLVDCIDAVQYAIRLLVPPGSALLASSALTRHLGGKDAVNFTHTWAHPDPRMDSLQHEVAAIAGDAQESGQDAAGTLDAIVSAASAKSGAVREGVTSPPSAARIRPPRLTEAWFC
jgi:radical SAM superfamily enzyme YgiQ (UPF0313 family)